MQNSTATYHVPVLLAESLAALNINPGGVYVDATFGGGGHSRAILQALGANGRLVAFDQDSDAARNLPADERLLFVPHNFRHLSRFLQLHGIGQIDGLLADLGVSSHQFDEGSRGFSTRFFGPLDMRMDVRQQKTAADVVNSFSETALHKLFEQYGEVTNAKTLARTIVAARSAAPVTTTDGLQSAAASAVKGAPHKYWAQVFQALRMEVNEEMDALKELLQALPQVLKTGGRVAIISFHSIEDRLVKTFFKEGTFEPAEEHPFLNVKKEAPLKPVTKKPVEATTEEQKRNPRARSAKLRAAEKI